MRPLRHYLPDRTYLITARCFDERFVLAPDTEEVALIVASTLALAVEKYELELFAYMVMSNHLHLVVRAPRGGLPEAMQLVLSQVARRINVLRNRRGPVFSDRYHHQTICDEEALHTAIRYVVCNPRSAGLSKSLGSWAGLSSFADTCENRVLVCTRKTRGMSVMWSMRRVDRRDLDALRSPEERDDGTREEHFVLACHPASLASPGSHVAVSHDALVASLRAEEKDALPAHVRPIASPDERPANPKRTRAPSCIATSSLSRTNYLNERRAFLHAYRIASNQFRRGIQATFPPGCCLPWPNLHLLLSSSDTFGNPGAHGTSGATESRGAAPTPT